MTREKIFGCEKIGDGKIEAPKFEKIF